MAGILQKIYQDWLCRMSATGCAKPLTDEAMASLASSNYRPKSVPPQVFSLQPGSTPEGFRTGVVGGEAFPDPQSPPAIAPGIGGAGLVGPPYKTEEVDQDEFRNVGTASGIGFATILAAQLSNDIDVLEMNFQAGGVTNLQVFRDGSPITGNYALAANQTWSAPGLTVVRSQGLTLNISAAVSVVFEVRWKWKTIAP